MRGKTWGAVVALHLGLVAVLFALNFVLPVYHQGVLARVMVLAVYAIGYNIAFGYTGLLSLGHAMFFGAGLYGAGLMGLHFGMSALPAWLVGTGAGALLALVVGALALRTAGVSFMIVTLMFAQAVYLTILYFGDITHGDDGFVVPGVSRTLAGIDLSQQHPRYLVGWVLFSAALLFSLWLVRAPFGRVLVAIRENEERARLLGYDTGRRKLGALVISGAISAASGAAYGLLFGYVGASFAGVQYSIFALLWVLLGGAGTVLGPFVGTLFMFYLIDLATGVTDAYMLIAGVVLVGLTLFAPQGIVGEVRRRLWRDLP
ncbi:branched-chain amino acid ABC transporter permease [Pseudooceanicola sediminis]|uniref:Branched-chain amino acid ABC transporter permease n=1 Tax=Pseudooceanicola sediminis TaxID=2211117 RepID=A0A399IZU2_9RHOB|nr:branched-chain amino acid ABC transporter permease [Pseudooceanicola sediminis]KAA2313856.1 branched-chain amino acid ABC transporter permease [Puniceibacterium sp. HSS470]RII38673.1 branched-chain amino acid ABC transporter permease [Pseudooceanicola sediminis]|tara:strand:- start:37467 stop:38417 length:951 start_codon:yes stop_codon:yes gene_type:complete